MTKLILNTAIFLILIVCFQEARPQGTRLLRQPSASDTHIAFAHGGDIWISALDGSNVKRITSTAAVEENPAISPDGKTIAFNSNKTGYHAVYTVPVTGGQAEQLTWHPSGAFVRGWSPDGKSVLYASSREFAPRPSNRLWTISKEGGVPLLLSAQRGFDGSFSPAGDAIAIDRVTRWESEFRNYRGGQNTPLILLNLDTQSEVLIPNERSIDLHPTWIDDTVYFLSDREGGVMNIWAYSVANQDLEQLTQYKGSDIKWLSGKDKLVFEREGYLHMMDPATGNTEQLQISISGDFPWAETRWESVDDYVGYTSISPSGKRILMEARGDIFTVPVEYGDARNLTSSSGVADRRPIWSPKGDRIAWFTDEGRNGYLLRTAPQDGLGSTRDISLGESKLAWEPVWSPDGEFIAFVDDDLRVRVVDMQSGQIKTVGTGGVNIERGNMGLSWSPDSRWLVYSKSGDNNFRRIVIWSSEENRSREITNAFADASSPAWDRDGKHLYFLASTEVALGSGWVNTSSMNSDPEYAVYVLNLDKSDSSPFKLRSDEENIKKEDSEDKKEQKKEESKEEPLVVKIDFDGLDRRIIPLPIEDANYRGLLPGPKGIVFITERIPGERGLKIHKYELAERKLSDYTGGVSDLSVSADGSKMLLKAKGSYKVADTDKSADAAKSVNVSLEAKVDHRAEWEQIFEEAWRYERDYFYDPNLHGRDWQVVYDRYAPMLPYVRHREDLSYILDQMNGELSVGHSFVFGGDFPKTGDPKTGLLGADLVREKNRWKISRIYTTENWNPELTSPLDEPGLKVSQGHYLVGVNGQELTAEQNPYRFLDGTVDKQTVLHINDKPVFEGHWTITVKPLKSENDLRTRAWVEDNRRMVDSLSNGKLAYVWVPNTSGQGLVSFNRYFFAQQDKEGAVIDARYNGGGLLDDYMVDLMTRELRAAYTNEVPGAEPKGMPAGILGPKVLLINEMAGSGGDFFPWVFRQQKAGLLIGSTTWGGLVKSSVHYRLIDGGALTAPDNAIFDPIKGEWIGENKGISPDIEVRQDAKSLSEGRDPQLERAVTELMKQLKGQPRKIQAPAFSSPASNGGN
ncbi:PDZ domain-containing protein [Zeaxanthinibacter sp. PT1]|uniref:S41 family peptidase n=1 Tax=Zeaxanthinibacter TaxID=561554 RepID=UPI00234B74C9|nr:S41 family peptidase [Zeaxanthinibacter sp. PT1]MDC6350895.1 PDZ domain-containing protein [Zeaxanthinibacter sp. PT1]